MTSETKSSKSLIIVGMHRSHTSLVASAFHTAGLFLGNDLIGANESNIHGHFESREIVDFHERIIKSQQLKNRWQLIDRKKALRAADSTIFKAQASELIREHFSNSCFGWKDPRVAFFLTGWHQVLPNPKYLIVHRHPVHVVGSLIRRNLSHTSFKFRPFLATRYFNLWDNTYTAILSFLEQYKPEYHFLSLPYDLAKIDSVTALNQKIQNWDVPIDPIDFEHVIDAKLLHAHKPSRYYEVLYQSRKRTKDIYQTLLKYPNAMFNIK